MCSWKFGMVSDMCSNLYELSVVHTPFVVFYSNQTSTLYNFVNRYCTTIPQSPSSYTHCTYMYTSIICTYMYTSIICTYMYTSIICTYMYTSIIFSMLVMFWSYCVVSISYIIVLFKLFGKLTASC